MSKLDEFATRYQRGIAAAVQAIGLIAQRVSPASAALSSTADMQRQICDLLLPLTMETEPVEQLPPGAVKPAQAAYWVTEGAAFSLLMLCDGPGAAAGTHGSASVWHRRCRHTTRTHATRTACACWHCDARRRRHSDVATKATCCCRRFMLPEQQSDGASCTMQLR
jgi:hypothetical protein